VSGRIAHAVQARVLPLATAGTSASMAAAGANVDCGDVTELCAVFVNIVG
jgi:hypothetical protein